MYTIPLYTMTYWYIRYSIIPVILYNILQHTPSLLGNLGSGNDFWLRVPQVTGSSGVWR